MAESQHSSSLLDISGINLDYGAVTIVHTEWNDKIVAEQIKGAKRILEQFNIKIRTYSVPGSFELPYACHKIAKHIQQSAIIAFGAVIKGGTPHFDYVCKAVTEGITQVNTAQDTPVIFGVLTLDNEEQAWERLGGAHGHKGEEAAITALKMIAFRNKMEYRNL